MEWIWLFLRFDCLLNLIIRSIWLSVRLDFSFDLSIYSIWKSVRIDYLFDFFFFIRYIYSIFLFKFTIIGLIWWDLLNYFTQISLCSYSTFTLSQNYLFYSMKFRWFDASFITCSISWNSFKLIIFSISLYISLVHSIKKVC